MVRPLSGSNYFMPAIAVARPPVEATPGLAGAQTQQELAFVQTAPVAIPLLLIIAARLAKSLNRPEQARQAQELQELQEQFSRTLHGLRFTGVLTPQQFDQFLREFNKALKGGAVGFASFQHWLKQFSSGTDTKIEARQKKFDTALTQARTSNSSLVEAMQNFSKNSPPNLAGLRALQNQAKAALITLQSARGTMKDLLAQAEAASLPAASRATLEQVNGWVNTAKDFCRRLEQHIARLPELGRETSKTKPPTVTTGGNGPRVRHINSGRSVTGEPAHTLEVEARKKYEQKIKLAAAWVHEQRRKGFHFSDDELYEQAARKFLGTEAAAGAVEKAVAAGRGVQGAENGGVRASSDVWHPYTAAKFWKDFLAIPVELIPLLNNYSNSTSKLSPRLQELIKLLIEEITQRWMAARYLLSESGAWRSTSEDVIQGYQAELDAMRQALLRAGLDLSDAPERSVPGNTSSPELIKQYAALAALLKNKLPSLLAKSSADLPKDLLNEPRLVAPGTDQTTVGTALENIFQNENTDPQTAQLFRYLIALRMAVTSVLQEVTPRD